MAKSEWGIKRVCQSCLTKYYDLCKRPSTCPECGAEFDPEAVLRSRRNRAPVAESAKDDDVEPKAADMAAEDTDEADGSGEPASIVAVGADGDDDQPTGAATTPDGLVDNTLDDDDDDPVIEDDTEKL